MIQNEWSITGELARLELDEQETIRLADEAERMRELFLTMSRADVDNLEPTTHSVSRVNRFRADNTEDFANRTSLLDAAPEVEDDFFLIPNVL